MNGARRRAAAWATALLIGAAGIGLTACGDDEETTVSPAAETTAEPATTSDLTVEPAPTTMSPPTTTGTTTTTSPSGGGAGGGSGKEPRDTEDNDIPPKPGSPEAAFEAECDANPDACS